MELVLGEVIRASARRAGGRPAVTHGSRSLTYTEVAEQSNHIASVLASRGISRGSRVVWWGDTCVDAVPLYFALATIGAVFVPINPALERGEARSVMDRADPALVLVDDAHDGDVTIAEILGTRRRSAIDLPDVREHDPHIIYFTSGTTGAPKGVVLSHRTDMLRSIQRIARPWPLGATVNMFPQFHMGGWLVPLTSWMAGDEVVYVERGDPDALLGAVDRHRGYRMYCIPAVWRRILDSDPGRFDTSTLREADTGTSATTRELIEGIRRAFPQASTSIVYGSTEAGGITELWPEDALRKPDSVGPPCMGVDVRIAGDDELLVRSPYLMTEYFRDPEATSAAMKGGWFHTGELADVDEEGFYRIVGRRKDIIRTGGETVAPAEVDTVLQSHPAVADAAVAGVPDPDWGEVITAFVVLRPGRTVTVDDLREHCTGRMVSFKHPRRMVVVDAIPRTSTTGQVQRRALLEIAQHDTSRRA